MNTTQLTKWNPSQHSAFSSLSLLAAPLSSPISTLVKTFASSKSLSRTINSTSTMSLVDRTSKKSSWEWDSPYFLCNWAFCQQVFDTQGKVLKEIIKQREGNVDIVATLAGPYRICWRPMDNQPKILSFEITVGDRAALAGGKPLNREEGTKDFQ